MCKSDSKDYLCVVSKSSRAEKTIDKATLEVTEGKRKNPGKFGDRQDFSTKKIGN